MNQNYGHQQPSHNSNAFDLSKIAAPEAARFAAYAPREAITPYVARIPATPEAIESAKNSLQTTTLELPRIVVPGSVPVRRVAKTLIEIEKPDPKKIAENTALRKVAKTLLELRTPELQASELLTPELKKKGHTQSVRDRSKTLIEAGSVDPKAIRRLLLSEFGSSPKSTVKIAKTLVECFTPPPIVDEISARRNYIAKTRLDRMAIAEVVLRFDQRKEEREAERANEAQSVEAQFGEESDFYGSDETDNVHGDDQPEGCEFLAENRREIVKTRHMFLAIVALAIISLVMMLMVPPAASPSDSPLNFKLWASLKLVPNNLNQSAT